MLLSEIFKEKNIILNVKSTTKKDLFEELTDFLVKSENIQGRKEEILRGLIMREDMMTTGIASNIALPHTHISNLSKPAGIIAISRKGIEYESIDNKPVHVIMLIIGDEAKPEEHLKILRNIALVMTNPDFIPTIMNSKSEKEVYESLEEFEEMSKFFYS